MITFTDEMHPVRQYTSHEILAMSPDKMRKELTHLCSMEPDMSGKIESIVGFEPHWTKMTVLQFAMVAVAWACLENATDELYSQADNIMKFIDGIHWL